MNGIGMVLRKKTALCRIGPNLADAEDRLVGFVAIETLSKSFGVLVSQACQNRKQPVWLTFGLRLPTLEKAGKGIILVGSFVVRTTFIEKEGKEETSSIQRGDRRYSASPLAEPSLAVPQK
jgi:hypothetical protein